MAKPPRKGTKKRAGLPKAPTRRSPTPGRVPAGGRGRPAAGTPRGKQGGGGQARATGKRQGLGGDQVEGRQAVRELLLARRRRVREVWLLAEQDPSDVLTDIVELAEAERVPVREVGRTKFFAEARCEAPQGVLAKAAPLEETPLDDLAARPAAARRRSSWPSTASPTRATWARCCARRSAPAPPGSCCPATGPCTSRPRSPRRPPAPSSTSGSPSSAACRRRCSSSRAAGVWVVGLDGDGPTGLWDLPAADGPIALVLGAEGSGLSRLVRQRCDELVSIPLNGALGLTERERRGRAGVLRGRPRPRRGLVDLLPPRARSD